MSSLGVESNPAAVRAPSQSVRLGNRVIRGPGQASGAPWPSLAPTAAPGNPPEFAVAAPPPGQRPGPGRSTADRESPRGASLGEAGGWWSLSRLRAGVHPSGRDRCASRAVLRLVPAAGTGGWAAEDPAA